MRANGISVDTALSEQQKTKVCETYLRHILGVSDSSIQDFVEDLPVLHKEIALMMSGMLFPDVKPAPYNERAFWEELKSYFAQANGTPANLPLYERIHQEYGTYGAKMGPFMLLLSANETGNTQGVLGRFMHFSSIYRDRGDGNGQGLLETRRDG